MITNSAQTIRKKYADSEIVLNSTKFTQTTDCEVFVADQKQVGMTKLGVIDCSIDAKTEQFYLYSNQDKISEHVDDAASFSPQIEFADIDELSARVVFETGTSGLSYILQTIIEASKQLHLGLSGDVRDVWFTGFNKARINCSADKLPKSGEICLRHLFTMGKGQYQTLSEVLITDNENLNNLDKFNLMFAYKI